MRFYRPPASLSGVLPQRVRRRAVRGVRGTPRAGAHGVFGASQRCSSHSRISCRTRPPCTGTFCGRICGTRSARCAGRRDSRSPPFSSSRWASARTPRRFRSPTSCSFVRCPFPTPISLVNLWERTPGYQMELSPANYQDWKASQVVRIDGRVHFEAVDTRGSGEPRRIQASRVTADLSLDTRRATVFSAAHSPRPIRRRPVGRDQLRSLADAVRRRADGARQARRSGRVAVHDHRRDAAGLPFSEPQHSALENTAIRRERSGDAQRQLRRRRGALAARRDARAGSAPSWG